MNLSLTLKGFLVSFPPQRRIMVMTTGLLCSESAPSINLGFGESNKEVLLNAKKIITFKCPSGERERESTSRGRGRGRSRLTAEQGARCRARSQDPEIVT
ncbi:unnamed protein product [Nyctereutes procyonoides]|uniref:(raccoon dog) hypothetical protein n=1 Tax=Nyctereutes procyonoides TaxID=34880 RepID=A0A811YE98_NYCPR|nr:unnamed protein product [Nyctereutes procyonoides]